MSLNGWGCDDNGDWDGTWISPDDAANIAILEGDVGFSVVLEGLDIIQNNNSTIYTTDEASVQTFGSAWGKPAPLAPPPPPPQQQDNSASTGNGQQCEGSATPTAEDGAATHNMSSGAVE